MPNPAEEIALVPFGPEHLEGALALSQQVGWPHRREDWQLVMALSRGCAALHEGRVVGTGFSTPFGPDLAVSNMIIVEETQRGRGLGRRLMTEIMRMANGRENRLIATADGLPLYRKFGFVDTGEIAQHQGVLGPVEAGREAAWESAPDASVLAELDQAAFGAERRGLIDRLVVLGRIAVLRHDGRIAGFAAARPFGRGVVAGPVVAETAANAEALLTFLFSHHPGVFMRVDVPVETGLGPWLERAGLPRVAGGTVMSTKPKSGGARNSAITYALSSQALG